MIIVPDLNIPASCGFIEFIQRNTAVSYILSYTNLIELFERRERERENETLK